MADEENPALKDQEEEEEERRRVCGFTFFQCGLCLLLLLLLGGIGGGVGGVLGTQSTSTGGGASDTTDVPTSSPTTTTVVTATSAPSLPTAMPSLHPTSTFLPTSSPVTIGPSVSPSVSPSASPGTSAPSGSPTISVPTQGPTGSPASAAPTSSPAPFIHPVFSHNASSQALSTGSLYTVQFDTEVENSYGAGQFTSDTTYSVPDGGVYVVSASIELDTLANQDLTVLIAGIEVERSGSDFFDVGTFTITATTIRYFTDSDDIDVQVLLNGGSARTITRGYFRIEQMSRGVPAGYTQAIVKSTQVDAFSNTGSDYTIPFDEVTVGSMDATNTTWTAPSTGKYLVYGVVASASANILSSYQVDVIFNIDGTQETMLDFKPMAILANWAHASMKVYDLTAGQTVSLQVTGYSGSANDDDVKADTQLVIFPFPASATASFSDIAPSTQTINIDGSTGLASSPGLVGTPTVLGPFDNANDVYEVTTDVPVLCLMTLNLAYTEPSQLNRLEVDILLNGVPERVFFQERIDILLDPSPAQVTFTYLLQNTGTTEVTWQVDMTTVGGGANFDIDFQMSGQFIEL